MYHGCKCMRMRNVGENFFTKNFAKRKTVCTFASLTTRTRKPCTKLPHANSRTQHERKQPNSCEYALDWRSEHSNQDGTGVLVHTTSTIFALKRKRGLWSWPTCVWFLTRHNRRRKPQFQSLKRPSHQLPQKSPQETRLHQSVGKHPPPHRN